MKEFDDFYGRSELLLFGDRPTEEVVSHVRNNGRGGTALDLGCGEGRNSLFLAEAGYDVTAVDSSQTGIDKLKWNARRRSLDDRITAVAADVRNYIFQSARYDLVIAITLFDHLPEPEIDPVLQRMAAAMKPGATAVIKVHTIEDPGYSRTGNGGASEMAAAIRHYFSRNELRVRLRNHWCIQSYEERREYDTTHGRPHYHGFAVSRIISKPKEERGPETGDKPE